MGDRVLGKVAIVTGLALLRQVSEMAGLRLLFMLVKEQKCCLLIAILKRLKKQSAL